MSCRVPVPGAATAEGAPPRRPETTSLTGPRARRVRLNINHAMTSARSATGGSAARPVTSPASGGARALTIRSAIQHSQEELS